MINIYIFCILYNELFYKKKRNLYIIFEIYRCFVDIKDQWVRDDLVFLVLFSFWFVGKKFRMFKFFYIRIMLIRIFFLIMYCMCV